MLCGATILISEIVESVKMVVFEIDKLAVA